MSGCLFFKSQIRSSSSNIKYKKEKAHRRENTSPQWASCLKYYLRNQELADQVNAKIEAAIGKQPLFYIGQTELVRMLQLKDIDFCILFPLFPDIRLITQC